MVIWITGISGAGKSTLAALIRDNFKSQLPELVSIDGDEVRELFGNNLGFKEDDRYRQIQRIQTFARMLDRQNMVVVVSALYAHPNLLEWNRENFSDYFEIYLEAPLEVVVERDPKGLYAKVARGEMKDVVGVDLPWHAPLAPDLKIKMEPQGKAEEAFRQIVGAVPLLADLEERENATAH